MAAGRNKLISLLKYYWDNHWKTKNMMMILCGSIASFMVKKVIQSKALYGRINTEILLKGLQPNEAVEFFKGKKSKEEILKYFMVFGGVPKYLEEIKLKNSFNQNINNMCFNRESFMSNEIQRIFYNQFKESHTYLRIVNLLKDKLYSFNEISQKLNISSGGGLKLYLENLENAEIIRSYIPFGKSINSKLKKYVLSDEFLVFYFKYIEPNKQIINENTIGKLFEKLTSKSFDIWLGFAFEHFCIKHSAYLAKKMKFGDKMLLASPFFEKSDQTFQIDLLYMRNDNIITVCEIKHTNKEISPAIIPGVERKCKLLKIPRGYSITKALISLYGPDKALKDSQYFDHILTLSDLF